MIERVTKSTTYLDELIMLFDLYRVFYRRKSDVIQAKKFLENRIQNNESVIFIARNDENTMVGFIQLYPLFSSTQMKGLWLLNDLFVTTEYRGQGYSKQLINAAKEHCKKTGYCGLMLETEKNNVIANKLYESTSFEIDEEHNFYFWNI